jgi:hypothetical protein
MAKKEMRWRTVCFGFSLILLGLGALAVGFVSRELLPAVGGTLLGFIIGMLVGFFVQEAKEWTRSAMTASVAVLTGAGAVALLRYGAPDQYNILFYPVGLVIGFGFGTVWEEIDPA